ncbi:hypothetical protein ACSMX9_28170 [Streptomyces sp. LE64]|uniref:hypothetical protein n=1 Tax=Streptomyces sp. LE64 TaxID=3448653 RepID=UPI0040423659
MAETRTPDLFDRLLTRTATPGRPDEVVPLARPRTAMPFERLPPAAPTETEAEIDAAPSRPVPEASQAPRATARSGPREALPEPASVLHRIERTVRSIETVRTSPPGAPAVAGAVAPVVLRSIVERVAPAPAVATEPVERSASPRPVAQPQPWSARPPAAARTAAAARAPVLPAAGSARRHEARTPPAPPPVRVSIGRLEVTTATREPRPERRDRSGRPEPVVALDAFLNRQEAT